jgi:hypothetical protein
MGRGMMGDLSTKNKNFRIGLVSWLTFAPQVHVELAKGWSKRAVYSKFADRLKMSYAQFVRYCNQDAASPSPSARPSHGPPRTAPAKPTPSPEKPRQESGSLPDFYFDPMDAYRHKFD